MYAQSTKLFLHLTFPAPNFFSKQWALQYQFRTLLPQLHTAGADLFFPSY